MPLESTAYVTPASTTPPVVVVCLQTFNQKDYVEQALRSLLFQKTNFSYQILVHDDASTDGTAEILRDYYKRYPEQIRLILQAENQYSQDKKILGQMMAPYIDADYVALNEGDDYWLSPDKLQIQYDYMSQNPDCSMCCHAAEMVDEGANRTIGFQRGDLSKKSGAHDFTMSELIWSGSRIPTNSFFFKAELIRDGFPDFYNKCGVGDYPMSLYFGHQGRVHFIDQVLTAYRVNAKGSWSVKTILDPAKHAASNRDLIAMLDRFDQWSGGTYTAELEAKKDELQFEIYLKLHDYKSIKLPPYRKYYRRLAWSNRLRFQLAARCPWLYRLRQKLR